jgi:hypothetical protein
MDITKPTQSIKTMKRKIKVLTKGIEKFKCDDREIDKIDSSSTVTTAKQGISKK